MNISTMAGRVKAKAKETPVDASTTTDKIVEGTNPSRMQKVKTSFKNGMSKTGKFFKELPKDTVDFVKKNPKKKGLIAGAVILAGAAGVVIGKAVKNTSDKMKEMRIENHFLKEKTSALQERVAEDTEMLEAMQDVVVAAQSIAAKAKKA